MREIRIKSRIKTECSSQSSLNVLISKLYIKFGTFTWIIALNILAAMFIFIRSVVLLFLVVFLFKDPSYITSGAKASVINKNMCKKYIYLRPTDL